MEKNNPIFKFKKIRLDVRCFFLEDGNEIVVHIILNDKPFNKIYLKNSDRKSAVRESFGWLVGVGLIKNIYSSEITKELLEKYKIDYEVKGRDVKHKRDLGWVT